MIASEQELRVRAEEIREAIRSGSIDTSSCATLLEYSAWLCTRESTGPFTTPGEHKQICETVRAHLLRAHIAQLQKHITDLDTKNTTLQKLVIALAVIAIVVGVVQVTVAILPYIGLPPPQPTASAPRMPLVPPASPSLQALPASGQATKK